MNLAVDEDTPSALPMVVAPWQQQLAEHAFTRPQDLLAFLQLPHDLPQWSGLRNFPMRVPRGFAERMEKGNPNDPLFLQVWPSEAESVEVAGFGQDAVGDLQKLKAGGVIHKYHGRALVVTTGACGVHCRFCFRRHFPYGETRASRGRWKHTLDTLRSDETLEEVILSGGDPLSLTDDKLADLFDGLESIPHLRRLRIHTRQPIVLPERVDDYLLAWLRDLELPLTIVLHVNHANELDGKVEEALRELRSAGALLLSQSVLLAGVNDSLDALKDLSEQLHRCGVVPYYLHLLDKVQGAAHFEVAEDMAVALVKELSGHLPGFLVPRLVKEIAGKPAKTPLIWS
jgi:EF-P beta-lysylation protein EpmB